MMKTGSRANLIAVFAAVSIGSLFGKSSGVVKRIMIPLVTCSILIGTWYYVSQSSLLDVKSQEHLGSVFQGGIKDEGSHGRTAIWKSALSVYVNHGFISGFGFGNTAFAMQKYQYDFIDIHNTLLSSLMDGGPIGFGLFIGGLIMLFFIVKRIQHPGTNIVAMMVYIYLILNSLTHTIHFTKWFWIPVTICLLLAEEDVRTQQEASLLNDNSQEFK